MIGPRLPFSLRPLPDTTGGDTYSRVNEHTQPIHTLQGARLDHRIHEILHLQNVNEKKAIFNSQDMKSFLGITTLDSNVGSKASAPRQKTKWRKLLRTAATPSVHPAQTAGVPIRQPEMLATAAVLLDRPAEAEQVLIRLENHLHQYQTVGNQSATRDDPYQQTRKDDSVQRALASLLNHVAEAPCQTGVTDRMINIILNNVSALKAENRDRMINVILNNASALGAKPNTLLFLLNNVHKAPKRLRDHVMNIVLDNVSFLGPAEPAEQRIADALKRIDEANSKSSPVERGPGSRFARNLRRSLSASDSGNAEQLSIYSNSVRNRADSALQTTNRSTAVLSSRSAPNGVSTPDLVTPPAGLRVQSAAQLSTRTASVTRVPSADGSVRFPVRGSTPLRDSDIDDEITSASGRSTSTRPVTLASPSRRPTEQSSSTGGGAASLMFVGRSTNSSATSISADFVPAPDVIPVPPVSIDTSPEVGRKFDAQEADTLIRRLEGDENWDNSKFHTLLNRINAYLEQADGFSAGLIPVEEYNWMLHSTYLGSATGLPKDKADIKILADAIQRHINPGAPQVREEQDELKQLEDSVQESLSARPSFVQLEGRDGPAQIDTEGLRTFMAQTDSIRGDASTVVKFALPADVRPDDARAHTVGFQDQHYADSAVQLKLFEKLFTEGENAPLAIMPNEADLAPENRSVPDSKDNTCLIIALLQHATGDYGLTSHTAAASIIRDEMETKFPVLKEHTTLLDPNPSTDYTAWLLNKMERQYGKKLDLRVVQINEFGEPVFEDFGKAGSNPAILINSGAHFRALKLNNDQLDSQVGQRLVFEFVKQYTERTFGADN